MSVSGKKLVDVNSLIVPKKEQSNLVDVNSLIKKKDGIEKPLPTAKVNSNNGAEKSVTPSQNTQTVKPTPKFNLNSYVLDKNTFVNTPKVDAIVTPEMQKQQVVAKNKGLDAVKYANEKTIINTKKATALKNNVAEEQDIDTPIEPKINPVEFIQADIAGNFDAAKSIALINHKPEANPTEVFDMYATDKNAAANYFGIRQTQINNQLKQLQDDLVANKQQEQFNKGVDDIGAGIQKPILDPKFGVPQENEGYQGIQKKIADLTNYKNNLTKAQQYWAVKHAVANNPDNDPDKMGKDFGTIMQNPSVLQQKRLEKKGLTVNDEQKYNTEQIGYNVLQDKLNQDHKDGIIDDDTYYKSIVELDDKREGLINKYPEFKRRQIGLLVAQNLGGDAQDEFKAASMGGASAMTALSKKTGIPIDQLKAIEYDDVPNESFLSNLVKGVLHPIVGISTGLHRSLGSAIGIDSDIITQTNETAVKGFDEGLGNNPYAHTAEPETIVDKNTLQNIPNPKAGKYNYTMSSISNMAGNAIGGLLGFIGTTKALGTVGETVGMSAAPAEHLGMYAQIIGSEYEDNYQNASRVLADDSKVGEKDNAGTEFEKNLYATLIGAIHAAAFEFLPKDKLGLIGKVEDATIKDFSRAIGTPTLEKLNKEGLKKWGEKVFDGIAKVTKESSKINAAQLGGGIVEHVINSMVGKDEKNGIANLFDPHKLGESFVAMALPLGIAEIPQAMKHSSNFRETLYDAGLHPFVYKANIDASVDKGIMTQEQANSKIQVVNTMANLIANTPEISPINGERLNHNQRVEYSYNKAKEIAVKAKLEQAKDDKPLKEIYENQIAELEKERVRILEGQNKESIFAKKEDTPTPLTEPIAGIDGEGVPIPKDKLTTQDLMPTIVIDGKEYQGKNHGEAMDKAIAAGENIPDKDTPEGKAWRSENGMFKDTEGNLLTREQSGEKYGIRNSEELADNKAVEGETEKMTTPIELSVEPKEQLPTVSKENKPLVEVLDKLDKEENYTINDLVNDVEGIAQEHPQSNKLQEAVDKYRKEQEDDFKLSGRGDMDKAESDFEKSVRDIIGEVPKEKVVAENKNKEVDLTKVKRDDLLNQLMNSTDKNELAAIQKELQRRKKEGEPTVSSEEVKGSGVGGDVEAQYNARKKSIEDKLDKQLENNKDRLDDIDEKGGTKTVRQKIYQEHTNDMVELEKWKMKEDLKSEKVKADNSKKDAVDDLVDFAENNLGKDDKVHPTTGGKLFELNTERLGNAVKGLRDKISNGTLRQVTKAIQTVREVLNVSFDINNRELGKKTEQKIDDIGIQDAKKRTDAELIAHVDELESVKRNNDSYASYKDTRGDTQYMMGNDNFDPYLTEAVNRGLVEIKDGKLTKAVEQSLKEQPKEKVSSEEGKLKLVDKSKDILDDVTDEKVGEKKYQDFSVDFKDGARAFGRVEDGVANISGINAPKKEGSIEAQRGTKTYERVLTELSNNGIETIKINLQSADSRKAIDNLVEKGILENGRDKSGGSTDEHFTKFDINKDKLKRAFDVIIEKKNTGTEIEPVLEGGRKTVTLSGSTETERQSAIEQRKKETKQTPMTESRDKILERIGKYNALSKVEKRSAYEEINKIKLAVDTFNKEHSQKHSINRRSTGELELKNNPTDKRPSGRPIKNTLKGEEKNIIENGKTLTEREDKVKDVFKDLLDNDSLPVSRDVNGNLFSEAQHEGTIQDIMDGIPSQRAENYLNSLEKQIAEDNFDFGNPDKNAKPVSFNDLLGIEKEQMGEPMTIESIDKWLDKESDLITDQEAFDNIDNLITHYEQQHENTEARVERKVEQSKSTGKDGDSGKVNENEQPQKEFGKNNPTEILEALDKAAQSKKSMREKDIAMENEAANYGEVGMKALMINRNFEKIVNELEQNKKIEKLCP